MGFTFDKHESKTVLRLLEHAGFVAGALVFTIVFSIILTLLNKMPASWEHEYIFLTVLFIGIVGKTLKRWLR